MGAEEMMVVGPNKTRWGTWEELILGGAVLRHGTHDWHVVASELQGRTVDPNAFTPEACKARYEESQKHYSGCIAWFEELRKQRVAELRRELEESAGSIGSLQSKLESLRAERGHYNQVGYGSSQTESPVPIIKSEGIESFGKEACKDGLSAGSFTEDAETNWPHGEYQLPVVSASEMKTEPEFSGYCEHENVLSITKMTEVSDDKRGLVRKRRGKRKRKDCSSSRDANEVSVGESDNLGSTNVVTTSRCKENLISSFGQTARSASVDSHNRGLFRVGNDDLMRIFNSVAENQNALVFKHRLDSQKRARYRMTIKRHMDFDTIRSRISSCTIKSVRELFRDLLLLANNALVFYSKRTREYKTALALRDIIMKANRQHYIDFGTKASSSIFYISPLYNPPVKPRSIRPHPFKQKLSAKLSNAESVIHGTRCGDEKPIVDDSNLLLQSLVMAKKGIGRPAKVGRCNQPSKTPMKERKRGPHR